MRALASDADAEKAPFELAAGRTLKAVAHRSVEEIWYVIPAAAVGRICDLVHQSFFVSSAAILECVRQAVPRATPLLFYTGQKAVPPVGCHRTPKWHRIADAPLQLDIPTRPFLFAPNRRILTP